MNKLTVTRGEMGGGQQGKEQEESRKMYKGHMDKDSEERGLNVLDGEGRVGKSSGEKCG